MPYLQKENEYWPVNVSIFLISSLISWKRLREGGHPAPVLRMMCAL